MPFGLGFFAAAGAGAAAGAFELISTQVLSSSASSVTFSSIPATYKHLQIRLVAKHTGSTNDTVFIRLNNDAGGNYAQHRLFGNGSGVFSSAATSATQAVASVAPRTITATTNAFASSVIEILDYASTSKNTTLKGLHGMLDGDGNNVIRLESGLWMNTAAVSRIDLFAFSNNLQTGSRFSLYGIKG